MTYAELSKLRRALKVAVGSVLDIGGNATARAWRDNTARKAERRGVRGDWEAVSHSLHKALPCKFPREGGRP